MKEVTYNRTDFIAVYDDVYTEDQCKHLTSYIDKLEDNSILINEAEHSNSNIEHLTLNMSFDYDLPAWSWVGDNINGNMQKCIDHYLKEFKPLGSNRFLINDFKIKKPISINELQENVWSYQSDIETHTVETHIYRLRKKILNTFNDKDFIISEKNGYQIK